MFVLATTDPQKVAARRSGRARSTTSSRSTPSTRSSGTSSTSLRTRRHRGRPRRARDHRPRRGGLDARLALAARPGARARRARRRARSSRLLGGSRVRGRVALLQSVIDEDVAGALVGLGELLDHGPRAAPGRRRPAARPSRDAFLLTPAQGQVRVDVPEDDVGALAALGDSARARASSCASLETLGQAVVDMRGADAADPRLVLEIALVRLARRDARAAVPGARRAGRAPRTRHAHRPRRRLRRPLRAPAPAPAPEPGALRLREPARRSRARRPHRAVPARSLPELKQRARRGRARGRRAAASRRPRTGAAAERAVA